MTGWTDDGPFAAGVPEVGGAPIDPGEEGRRGALMLWCDTCQRYYSGSFTGKCPACGMQTIIMRCTRCGHRWWLRRMKLPQVCPKCCSPYYCRERVRPETRRRKTI